MQKHGGWDLLVLGHARPPRDGALDLSAHVQVHGEAGALVDLAESRNVFQYFSSTLTVPMVFAVLKRAFWC